MARRRVPDPPWTPFRQGTASPEQIKAMGSPHTIALNSRYQVCLYTVDTPLGPMDWLSIKRLDKAPIHDWRDLQRIKNELLGPEREAVELYPAESRLMDTSNQYHLWALPPGKRFPFGMVDRCVTEEQALGTRQRPWPADNKPADLVTGIKEHMRALLAQPPERTSDEQGRVVFQRRSS